MTDIPAGVEGNQTDAANNGDQAEDESEDWTAFLRNNVAVNDHAFESLTVPRLVLCHRENAIGSVGRDPVIAPTLQAGAAVPETSRTKR